MPYCNKNTTYHCHFQRAMPISSHRFFPYQAASGGSAKGCRLRLQAKRDALLRHLRAAADGDELQQQRERVSSLG
jgi:hypothetical protein